MSILSKHAPHVPITVGFQVPNTGLLAELPGVLEFLMADAYPDGQVRKRSTITMFVEDGQIKLCLNDRDAERTLWRSGTSIEECFLALEIALQEPGTDWRKSSSGNRPKGTKK